MPQFFIRLPPFYAGHAFGLALFGALSFGGALSPARAQINEAPTKETETIIVTGLRPLSLEEVTSSVSLIDAATLAIRNTPYLVDQLRAVPGLGVSRSGASGGLTQVRLRGAEANHTLVLLNGIEISDPATGETDFGLWAGIPTRRIEVLRGEQSALYGSDAIGGVINILTKNNQSASGFLEVGSESTSRANVWLGGESTRGTIGLGVSSFYTDGVDTSGQGGEEDGSEAVSGTLTGELSLGKNWSAHGLVRYGRDEVETDADTNFDGLLDDNNRISKSQQFLFGGTLVGAEAGFDHIFRASFNEVHRKNFADEAFTDNTTGKRTKLSYSPSRVFIRQGTKVVVSGLLDYEREDYQRVSTMVFFGDPNQRQSFETFGLASDLVARWARLTLTGSARFDANDSKFKNATAWRFGGAFAVREGTRLRGSVGTGVKNPTFTELFGFFPGSFTGNPDLKPEKSFSAEIGLDHTIGPASVSLTWFNASLEDEIFTVFNPDFTSSPANRRQDSERRGLELSARWALSPRLSLAAAFTDLSSKNENNNPEIRVPEQTGSLSLDWQSSAQTGLRAGFALDYVGEQDDFFFTFPAQRVTLDRYTLASASLDVPFTPRATLTLRGQNIFDEEVRDVFGFKQPGAGFFVGFKVR